MNRMSKIDLSEMAYVVYQVPDLDLMEKFLIDFGMSRAERTPEALYMRGDGPSHHVHVSRLGPEPAFLGIAFLVGSRDALELAARIPDATAIKPITDPGGGERVTLTTPGGHTIWLEYGADQSPVNTVREAEKLNFVLDKRRFNTPVRQSRAIAKVLKIGHAVLRVTNGQPEVDWLMEHFNLVPSDYICAPGDPDPIVLGTFLRYDRGAEFVEHHCLLVNESSLSGCHHSSFEVIDLDAIMTGNEHLRDRGWTLDAGVGRHYLGSLIYDYWLDPFGNRIEHYTDTDMVNKDHKPVHFDGPIETTTQWGPAPPPTFFD